jgi:hypothetical protein
MYHTRLSRGPSTNGMKKWDGPSRSWPTPHTTPLFLPPEDPSLVLLRPNSIPVGREEPPPPKPYLPPQTRARHRRAHRPHVPMLMRGNTPPTTRSPPHRSRPTGDPPNLQPVTVGEEERGGRDPTSRRTPMRTAPVTYASIPMRTAPVTYASIPPVCACPPQEQRRSLPVETTPPPYALW